MLRTAIIPFLLVFLTSVAYAEVYKWEDANGMHYTDSPASVPEKYREKVYEETGEQIRNSKPQVREEITPQNLPIVIQENQAAIYQTNLEQQRRTSETLKQQQDRALAVSNKNVESVSNTFQSTGTIGAYFSPREGTAEAMVSKSKNVHLTIYVKNTFSTSSTISAPAAEAVVVQSPSQLAVSESNTIDWNGIWIDTGVLLGSQFAACGIIYMMPESVSQWTPEQKRDIFKHYGNNFVDPVWDKDAFYVNYVLHPYWGGTYYIRGRDRGLDKFSSFVYSALMSAMFEFGPECFFEKPSFQDLIVTPIVGALLGAFVFEPWRNYIKHKPELYWYDHVSLMFTDPIGILSLGFEKMFGTKSTILVDYSPLLKQKRATGTAVVSSSDYIGATLKFQWN